MLAMYNRNTTKIQANNANRCKHVIGHEKYCNCKERGTKRRRRFNSRQTKSATEFNPRVLSEAAARATPRSTSSEQVKAMAGERTPLITGKMESLVRLFSCVSVQRNESPRHNGAYAYTALEPDATVHERLEFERKARERAQSVCSHFLRNSPRYTLVVQLNDVGSRVDKHWFVVRDASVKTERLLTLVPRGGRSPLQCTPETRDTVLDLFLALQHPYIYPVLDIDFHTSYIVTVLPLNEKGSLKDFIYKSRWQEDWGLKYSQRSVGLPVSQIQRLGRQILEALLFLRERGFPPYAHLHSGNIVLQNGVARLAGLENALLGSTSRVHPVLWPRAAPEPHAVDSLCFGHVLFEMAAGYELDAAQPTPGHLLDLHQSPQVLEVLEFIFDHPKMRLPTVEELLLCDLFRNIDLREMRNQAQSTQVFKTNLTPSAVDLLSEIRKFQSGRNRVRTHGAPGEGDASQRERSTSSGGSEGEVDEDAYDADANSDGDVHPSKEHRHLSLHASSPRLVNLHSTSRGPR